MELELILNGTKSPKGIVTKNPDGSITLTPGFICYEDFHEAINNLFISDKLTVVEGKHEDFVKVKSRINILIK